MRLINFDAHFQQHTAKWVQQHGAEYGDNYDAMEDAIADVYLAWLSTPADWLDGACPGTYFNRFDDAGMLARWMCVYFSEQVPVPDQLLERLADMGTEAEPAVYAVLGADGAPRDAVLTAISLLTEMESRLPLADYIEWIAEREQRDDRADLAAEAVRAMGEAVIAPILAKVSGATAAGRLTFFDILANFPGEEAIYALGVSLLNEAIGQRALVASLLGKLGDVRAVEALLPLLSEPEISYLDYIEIRNAVEALGGELPSERVFDGDPHYEALKRMET